MKAIAPEWNQWTYASSGAITQSPFEKRVKKTHVTYIITRTNLLFFIFIRNDVALTGEIFKKKKNYTLHKFYTFLF